MILSGRIMLEYLGWTDAADLVRDAVEAQIVSGEVTYDIERNREDATRIGTSEFADGVVDHIGDLA
jgi:isocitrate dehydrogenase